MKKAICFILTFLIFTSFVGCDVKDSVSEPAKETSQQTAEKIKQVIPISERKCIYNNGIETTYKEAKNTDENKVETTHSYHIISGLKDKTVQSKINKDLEEIGSKLLTEFEAELMEEKKDSDLKIIKKSTYTYITYNFNNVVFIESTANIEANIKGVIFYPGFKNIVYGYDLNTGNKIGLADIFKPGIDYKTKINNFICQYIIENNYDDLEAERMNKPFQGIREDQSYSFDVYGLRIILDEKNNEFVNNGGPEYITIPLKYFDDDLYIFDKYFDKNINIFEKEKLVKKLYPNQLEYKANDILKKGNEKYFIDITYGQFINVPNKEIEKKLNELVMVDIDIEGFKKKANAVTEANRTSHLGFYVNVFLNAGGYLSMAVAESTYINNDREVKTVPFNYDFNLNKEITLSDIFIDKVDIDNVIKSYIKESKYPVSQTTLEKEIKEALSSNRFYFDEYGISIPLNFFTENEELLYFEEWIWIPFEKFGIENIKLFY